MRPRDTAARLAKLSMRCYRGHRMRALSTVLVILRMMAESRRGVTVDQLATACAVSRRTVYRYLATLQSAGYPLQVGYGNERGADCVIGEGAFWSLSEGACVRILGALSSSDSSRSPQGAK